MDYVIKSLKLELQFADGTRGVFEQTDLPDDVRTVLVGLDAYGAAGSHDPAEWPGLQRVAAGTGSGVREKLRASAGTAQILEADPLRASAETVETRSYQLMSQSTSETPAMCVYRNGRWYCW